MEQHGNKMADPQALIIYGDGQQAIFYDDKSPTNDRDGVKVYPVLVVPSQELVIKYGLKDEDLNIDVGDRGRMGLWMEYPIKQVDWLSRSKKGALILVWCGFDGRNTLLTDKMLGLHEWDMNRDKMENNLKAGLATVTEIAENALSNPMELFRKLKEMEEIVKEKTQLEEDDER